MTLSAAWELTPSLPPPSSPASVLSGDSVDSAALQGVLRQMMDAPHNPRLPQALRPLSHAVDVSPADHGAAGFRETPSLSSFMSSLLQESSEEDGDDAAVVADGRTEEDDAAAGIGDGLSLSRLVAVGMRRPPASRHAGAPRLLLRQPLRLRYPPSTSRK